MTTKQIDIKNRTYYFYNDLINIENFDLSMLKPDEKTVLNHDVYYIGYITKKPQWSVNSVNPLYLMINKIKGHFKEADGDKYLIISSENVDIMQKYQEVFHGIKEIIKKINDYSQPIKDDDNYRFATQKDGKYYPQVFLDECLY